MLSWKHGAEYSSLTDSTNFRLWAPLASRVDLHLWDSSGTERSGSPIKMEPAGEGYWGYLAQDCPVGTRYAFSVDNGPKRPDPASRWQPESVHTASAVIDTQFKWTDTAWFGLPLEEYVIYEIHVGTFTDEGTFDAAIEKLPHLKKLGITAIEIMPVAQFPGDRNWGYDGVYLYAAATCYGGLHGLQRFVDAAHNLGIAVILDVVYNHLGPEGNYLSEFGAYFNDNYHTPWGAGLNFDAAYSNGVRDFFTGNALFWMRECHIDALRLDAVHAIIDNSARTFLAELSDAVHNLGRHLHKRLHVIGENDRNDPRFTTSAELGGTGADSQWSDDFHHALHAALTSEDFGYYEDFGKLSQLAKAYTDGFVYDGCYSPHRKLNHGANSRGLDGIRFVVFSQNHDQVGNRPDGSRLSMLLGFSATKLAAAALLASPYVPLIFMGEEFGCKSPFLYFVDHGDEGLIKAVREGRAREFRAFFDQGTPVDPQSIEAFEQSKLRPSSTPEQAAIFQLYSDLLRLRREIPALSTLNKRRTLASANDLKQTLVVQRQQDESTVLCLFNFSAESRDFSVPAQIGKWRLLFHTESPNYLGTEENAGQASIDCRGELHFTLPKTSAAFLINIPHSQHHARQVS